MTTNSIAKTTVKNATVRPFALSNDNAFSLLQYRYDPAESWTNALVSSFIVLPSTLQDVRSDARHALKVEVDLETLNASGLANADVDLLVLIRDNFSKKIVTLHRKPLSEEFELLLEVNRSDLEATSMVRRIDFEVMLVTNKATAMASRPIRPGARLLKQVISVSTESQGLSFNYCRTTSEEFVKLGLPGGTTFHIELDSAVELVKTCDDVSSVFKVLVHADAWTTLQEIRAGEKLGEALGTMLMTNLVFDLVSAVRQESDIKAEDVEEGSVIHRLLAWLSEPLKIPVETLKSELFTTGGLLLTEARLQEAFKLTRSVKRVQLNAGDDE